MTERDAHELLTWGLDDSSPVAGGVVGLPGTELDSLNHFCGRRLSLSSDFVVGIRVQQNRLALSDFQRLEAEPSHGCGCGWFQNSCAVSAGSGDLLGTTKRESHAACQLGANSRPEPVPLQSLVGAGTGAGTDCCAVTAAVDAWCHYFPWIGVDS